MASVQNVPPPHNMHDMHDVHDADEAPLDTSHHLPEDLHDPTMHVNYSTHDVDPSSHMHEQHAYAMQPGAEPPLPLHEEECVHGAFLDGSNSADALPRHQREDAVMHERSATPQHPAEPDMHAQHVAVCDTGGAHASATGATSSAPDTIEGVAEGWQKMKGALLQSFTSQDDHSGPDDWEALLQGKGSARNVLQEAPGTEVGGARVLKDPTALQSAAAEALASNHARLAAAAAAAATEHHAAVLSLIHI